jgi:Type IIA topoisomerase (DNA gyrase/topo II, topoisomerase IV), B subunit
VAKKKSNYDDSSIQVLEGLEAVRKRPGMYIGSTDARGLHHLVYEIVDNAVDEALSGFGKEISVIIEADNAITVQDYGRGMPVGMHASGIPTAEVIMTVLHAGGKFGQADGYKTSGGLHGVGASVVNALSEHLTLTIVRDGFKYQEKFENGGHPVGTLEKVGKTRDPNGTRVSFKPDATIFTTVVYNYQTLAERLRESAFLLKGVKITLTDKRVGQEQEEIFQFDEGIKAIC